MLTAGLGGADRHGCVALSDGQRVVAVCEQERVNRVRGAGFNATGLPDEALDLLLQRGGHRRADVGRRVIAEGQAGGAGGEGVSRIDHHLAHASAAYFSSPFSSATIVVCDHEAPKLSVWKGSGAEITRIDWPWHGDGFADVYSRSASILGFDTPAGDQRMEALARLRHEHRDDRIDALLQCDGTSLRAGQGWELAVERQVVETRGAAGQPGGTVAAALQTRLGALFVELLASVRRRTDDERLCLAGSLFYHSSINTAVKRSGLFTDVFIPVDPGNPGLAVGTALYDNRTAPRQLSPFLGPAYSAEEVKQTLENCKLQYNWESEDGGIGVAVDALLRGHLVGWYDGAMEWGPRALGARCILANPFSPFVLENLNRFLKRREPWRGYALSGLEESIPRHFAGPPLAPFMECDYRPLDPARFAPVLPAPGAALRVQTVGTQAPPRFRRLLEAFGNATGLPFLVNTSFNGFHEPIVCSPRDAVRVFYGSGLDLLVLSEFVLAK